MLTGEVDVTVIDAMLVVSAPSERLDLAGWPIAGHYGDPDAEAVAVREAVGIIDHTARGRLAVRGETAGRWLNRIVTNDTASLAPGDGCRALLLTAKGRIVCDLRVHRLTDRLLIDTAFDTGEGLRVDLERKVLFGDAVEVLDVRPETVQIGVHGPAAAALVESETGVAAGELARYGAAERAGIVVTRTDAFGDPGYEVIVPAPNGAELWRRFAAAARPFGWRAAEALRIEAGLPRWGAELTPDVLPLEAELEEALSHTKGCYPGQEVVARMRDRGHANRLLRALAIEGHEAPSRGAELLSAGAVVGRLTSAARTVRFGVVGLGYVRRAAAEPGTRLEVDCGGVTRAAEVVLRQVR